MYISLRARISRQRSCVSCAAGMSDTRSTDTRGTDTRSTDTRISDTRSCYSL